MSNYVAGSCNIGQAEIHQRYRVAIIGFLIYVALGAYFVVNNAPTSDRLFLFLPAMAASVGFVQARKKFCLAYGYMGVFNFGKTGQTSAVKDPAALAADRKYATKVLLQSCIPAAVLTFVVTLF